MRKRDAKAKSKRLLDKMRETLAKPMLTFNDSAQLERDAISYVCAVCALTRKVRDSR